MAYFTPAFIDFFHQLEINNDRDWFSAHKPLYEKEVKKPFEVFVGDLIDRMQAVDRNLLITPKDAIFRIYRDTRFSKDKTPYKTQVSAIISPGGRKDMDYPGMYIELGGKHVRVYSGSYQPDKNQLQKIREKIITEGKRFQTLVSNKDFVKYYGEVRGEKYKVLPKEIKAEAENQPVLFNKQFYYFSEWKPDIVTKKDFLDQIMDRYMVARPLTEFLIEALT
ncbi:MAG: DUF2461 domain-containing protein [Saprospiraceae bacterium]|nr:DUF2461 domain-containing protein [Saprospiraceae bacterium]